MGRIEEKMDFYVGMASDAQPGHRASGRECHSRLAVCPGHTTSSSKQDVFEGNKFQGRRPLQLLMRAKPELRDWKRRADKFKNSRTTVRTWARKNENWK